MTSPRRTLERVLKGPVGGMLLCLLIAGFLGGVAVAHPGGNPNKATSQTSPSDEPSEAPETPDPPEQDQQSDAPDAGGGGGATTQTAADCQGALTDVQGQLPAAQDATGLAHAIQTVEANCEKNLQAPGLVNALGHLATNWLRHQAHDAEKAAEGQGNAGVHGNSGVHGNAGVHGNSASHGPSSGGTGGGS